MTTSEPEPGPSSLAVRCAQQRCLEAVPVADHVEAPVAVRLMMWPGRAPIPVCRSCWERAGAIATSMGFYLHSEEIR